MVYSNPNREHKKSFHRTNRVSYSQLPEYIESTFKDSEEVKPGMQHPTKPLVRATKVYDILPSFDYLFEKLIVVNDAPNEKILPSSNHQIYLL